jgi:hypothetical protein
MIAGWFDVRTIEELAAHVEATAGIKFANPRQPTAPEMEHALSAIEGDPKAIAFMQERGHPFGQVLSNMRRVIYERLHNRPLDTVGQPVAIEVPPARIKDGDSGNEGLAWLTPEEARDRLRWAEAQGTAYADPLHDAQHEEHDALVAQIAQLTAIRDAPPAEPVQQPPAQQQPAAAAQQPQQPGPPIGATPAMREAQRARLHADPRYLNRQHPEHAAAMEEMRALYATDYDATTPVSLAGQAGESLTPLPNVIHGPGPLALPPASGPTTAPASPPTPVPAPATAR